MAPGTEVRALTVSVLDEKGGEVDRSGRRRRRPHARTASPATSSPSSPTSGRCRSRDRGLERGDRLGLPAQRGGGGDRASSPACRTARATRCGRPATGRPRSWTTPTTARRPARRCAWSRPRAATTCSTRCRRGLGRPQEARPRGRPPAVVALTVDGARAELPGQVPLGRGGGEERGALPRRADRLRARPTSTTRTNLSYVLDHLARATGGRYEIVLSAMGADGGAAQAVRRAARRATASPTRPCPTSRSASSTLSVARPKTKAAGPGRLGARPAAPPALSDARTDEANDKTLVLGPRRPRPSPSPAPARGAGAARRPRPSAPASRSST